MSCVRINPTQLTTPDWLPQTTCVTWPSTHPSRPWLETWCCLVPGLVPRLVLAGVAPPSTSCHHFPTLDIEYSSIIPARPRTNQQTLSNYFQYWMVNKCCGPFFKSTSKYFIYHSHLVYECQLSWDGEERKVQSPWQRIQFKMQELRLLSLKECLWNLKCSALY